MKTRIILSGTLLCAAITFQASAGTLFYVPIPPNDSDARSGLDSSKLYTSGIAAGNTKTAGRAVNGVQLTPLSGSENVCTAGGVTLSAATGTLANGGGQVESIKADGAMASLLSSMIFNDGAGDNSEQYVVLDPATLAAGKTYDLRVYIGNATGENRQVALSFAGDGKPAVVTDFFNEDDATTSGGGFAEPNQVYYINYRFTWDGVSTPGFTATQRFGSKPFCLFALTNQEVGNDVDARPSGAVVVHPAPIAEAPTRRVTTRTTRVNYDDEIGVSSEVFYRSDTLRRHGRWVTVGRYGRCWQPADVGADWQPYTRGRWVHSVDDGWVWDSDEDFGWATYHYGRWFREEDSGWYWVPGRVWAPAWVSWRHGHSYVGWAPLPPVALAIVGVGIGSWADSRWDIGPQAYSFVNARDFGAPSLANVIISRRENVNIITNTNNVTNIVNSNNTIYNGGPSFPAMNNALVGAGAQPIRTVQVNRRTNALPVTPDGKFSQLSAGVLALSAPAVIPSKKASALPPVAAKITTPKIDKGWKGIPDPTKAAALQAKIASETPGAAAKTAPASLPGTIPSATAGATSGGKNALKPFRPGKAGDHAAVKPGAPIQPVQPGQPVNPIADGKKKGGDQPPTVNIPGTKPGQPISPAVIIPPQPGQPAVTTPPLPGQPMNPIAITPNGNGKPGGKQNIPNVPLVKPGQPMNPIAITPNGNGKPGGKQNIPNVPLVKPGQPVNPIAITPTAPIQPGVPPTGKGKRGGKPGVPFVKPGAPVNPTVVIPQPDQSPKTPEVPLAKPDHVEKPGTVSPPITVPPAIQPVVPTTPKPEGVRSKNRRPQTAPVTPPTVVKPTAPEVSPTTTAPIIKPAPTPEPVRIKRKPEPNKPVQVPRVAPTPAPAPVRVPEPEHIKKKSPPAAAPTPAPAPRQIQRPAPVVIQPRPAPQPVAPPRRAPVVVQPRPAPQPVAPPRPAPVVVQPRPAPPINIPSRPVAPAPVPGKGPQPTPTPTPGPKR